MVPDATLHRIAPDESGLFLLPPPFQTVRDELNDGHPYWRMPEVRVGEISPDRALIIAEFRLGSDTLVVLDYRDSLDEPCVLRLQWRNGDTRWLRAAASFLEFATILELDRLSWPATHPGSAR